jgi:hypothetical protein
MKDPEWIKYKVGTVNTRYCQPFSAVRHIAHIEDAIRIMEDGLIRSSLVWDESRLKNSRTCVSWVSPNSWGHGSIYGNVSFEFDWNTLGSGKKLYWVEAITTYHPHAYRILVSDQNYESWDELVPYPYDVKERKGPIYWDGKTWYRNARYIGELLIDRDLPLHECREIRFMYHNPRICKKNGSICKHIKLSNHEAGAIVLANLIGRRTGNVRQLFLTENNDDLAPDMRATVCCLKLILKPNDKAKAVIFSEEDATVIFRAALTAYGEDDRNAACRLSDLIGPGDMWDDIFKNVLSKYFGLSAEKFENRRHLRGR